jgi:hypothetical protein
MNTETDQSGADHIAESILRGFISNGRIAAADVPAFIERLYECAPDRQNLTDIVLDLRSSP